MVLNKRLACKISFKLLLTGVSLKSPVMIILEQGFIVIIESVVFFKARAAAILFASDSSCPPHRDGQWFIKMCNVSVLFATPFTYKISRVLKSGLSDKTTLIALL